MSKFLLPSKMLFGGQDNLGSETYLKQGLQDMLAEGISRNARAEISPSTLPDSWWGPRRSNREPKRIRSSRPLSGASGWCDSAASHAQSTPRTTRLALSKLAAACAVFEGFLGWELGYQARWLSGSCSCFTSRLNSCMVAATLLI